MFFKLGTSSQGYKFFYSSLLLHQNKLQCLPQAGFFCCGLISTGKAKRLLQRVLHSAGSCLVCKYYTRQEERLTGANTLAYFAAV
jgi:hypothetical protein